MNIAIIGAGNVGGTLGELWAARGHEITFGVRDPANSRVEALLHAIGPRARAASIRDAVRGAPTIVLAVPWDAAKAAVQACDDLSGKVLVDCTNPVAAGLAELSVGLTTSAAEEIASWANGARVVKAFNTLGAEDLPNPTFGELAASMMICGDVAEAKAVVSRLAEQLGFDVIDAGPLSSARLLEPLAVLWIRLAYVEGLGPNIAFRLLRR